MTIDEIAKMAGVSKAAVSRYLNQGYVSDEKKVKIREVIEKTGYKPSVQAQMLRTKKTRLIGVVLPKISSESIGRMVSGISTVLSEAGYQILMADTENNVDKELVYLKLFRENPVDGILFIATIIKKEHKEFLQSANIPIVMLGQHSDLVSCVYFDDFGAAKELTNRMINANRRNIAYIGVTQKDKAAGLCRKLGYVQALEEAGLNVVEKNMLWGEFTMESGYTRMKKLLKEDKTIDGVFCATDSIAIGAMKYIKEAGKKIPDDINIVGIGHTNMSVVVEPELTTAHFYYKTSGIEAAHMLVNMLERKIKGVTNTKLGYEIIQTNSVSGFPDCAKSIIK